MPSEGEGQKTGTTKSESEPAEEEPKREGLYAGDWKIIGNPKPEKEEFTNSYAMKFQAKNESDSAATAMFSVGVVKGEDLLGTLDCIGTGKPVAAGETTTITCTSMDQYKSGWSELTFEDSGY